jgi:dTDP-4-dehydrorhamnose 3,5-epimerase-like enzyme
MEYSSLNRKKHIREDGWLVELISMNYRDQPFRCVHGYLVSITPNHTRANHFHRKKEEWMGIVTGKIKLNLVDIVTKENNTLSLDSQSDNYELIYVPPGTAHAIKNIDTRVSSIIIFSRNPEDPEDTYPYEADR